MRVLVAIVLAIICSAGAVAGELSDCRASARGKGGKLIRPGDSERRAWEALGKPDRIVQLQTRSGGAVGQEWVYYDEGYNASTTRVAVSRGKVTRVCIFSD